MQPLARISALFSLGLIILSGDGTFASVPNEVRITTSQYNNARTGADTSESKLIPRTVNAQHFGKLFSMKVDGDVYAQPLYLPGLQIPGKGKHNVIFVATEHDSVYALDADHTSSGP